MSEQAPGSEILISPELSKEIIAHKWINHLKRVRLSPTMTFEEARNDLLDDLRVNSPLSTYHLDNQTKIGVDVEQCIRDMEEYLAQDPTEMTRVHLTESQVAYSNAKIEAESSLRLLEESGGFKAEIPEFKNRIDAIDSARSEKSKDYPRNIFPGKHLDWNKEYIEQYEALNKEILLRFSEKK